MRRSDKKREQNGGAAVEPRLPKALFTSGYDDIATQWHKNPDSGGDVDAVRRAMVLEGFRVSEALLIAPKVSFKVHGENVVVCRLVDMFGVAGVERLIEEGAIEFVLWRCDVLTWEKPMPGLRPLAPSTLTTPAHSDPQASAEMGLKGWSQKPWHEVERLAKLVARSTILPATNLAPSAVAATYAAHANGALASAGMPAELSMDDFTPAQRRALGHLGADVLEGLLLLENDYDIHETTKSWQALLKVARFPAETRVLQAVEHVLRLEGLPSIGAMMLGRALAFDEIVELRSHPATQHFRRWLWGQPDPRDVDRVARAYASEITGKRTVDKTWFKVAKIAAMGIPNTAIGAVVGGAVAGPPGTVLGGAAGVASALGEAFVLDKLLAGTRPRRFAEEVLRPKATERTLEPAGNRKQRRAAAARARTK